MPKFSKFSKRFSLKLTGKNQYRITIPKQLAEGEKVAGRISIDPAAKTVILDFREN